MWLFEAPKNYTEMCKKIASSVFYITLIEVFILTQASSDFANIMVALSFGVQFKINEIKLNIALIYLPIIFSVLENIFKLHDLFGKIFNLRNKYSGSVIFYQYVKELYPDNKKSYKACKKIYLNNESLQKTVGNHFYTYASSTNPKIDAHYVHMALDSWCWVWILLDNIVISLLFLIVTILASFFITISKSLIWGLLIYIFNIIVIKFLLIKTYCKKYSIIEVKKCVKYDKDKNSEEMNNTLKEEIKNALSH